MGGRREGGGGTHKIWWAPSVDSPLDCLPSIRDAFSPSLLPPRGSKEGKIKGFAYIRGFPKHFAIMPRTVFERI